MREYAIQKNKGEKQIEMKKEIQLDHNGKPKFGMRDKVAYAAGDLGCNMSFGLKATVQTFCLRQSSHR